VRQRSTQNLDYLVTIGIWFGGVGLLSGCSLSVKPDWSAKTLAQYSNPSTIVDLRKGIIEISASANGELTLDDVTISKDGTLHVKGNAKFQSSPELVIDAEGRRVPAAVLGSSQLAMMEMTVKLDAGLTERHRIVGENMKAAGQMVALAAVGGGEAIKSVMDGVAPVLAGSSANLDLAKMMGSVTLGGTPSTTTAPAPVVGPVP